MKTRQWVLLALPLLLVLATVVIPASADPARPALPAPEMIVAAATAAPAAPILLAPDSESAPASFPPSDSNSTVPGTEPGDQANPMACTRCVEQQGFCANVPLGTVCGIHHNCQCGICNGKIDCYR